MPSKGEEGIQDGSAKGGKVAHAQEEEGGRKCGSLVPLVWELAWWPSTCSSQLQATLPLGPLPCSLGHPHVHLLLVNEPPFDRTGRIVQR